jgi:hypothetical protein
LKGENPDSAGGKSLFGAAKIDFLHGFSLDMPDGNTVISICNGFPSKASRAAFLFETIDDQHSDAVSFRGIVKR